VDLEALKGSAVEAALAAGKAAQQGQGTAMRVHTKSSAIDLVTEYDQKAQDIIVQLLKKRYPGHGFLSEENLDERGKEPYLWVIDPIDGTTNFAHGSPIFAVSISLLHHLSPMIGVVYAPCMNELFIAVREKGVWLNDKPIRVSKHAKLEQSVLGTGFSYSQALIEKNLSHFGRFIRRSRAIRRLGSAALDMCWVAMGRFDGYWELDLKPWDVAAGWLMVEQAGGRVSDFRGGPFALKAGSLLCSNGLIHDQMMTVLCEEA